MLAKAASSLAFGAEGLLAAFSLFWFCDRLFAYFWQTFEQAKTGFAEVVLNKDAAKDILETFASQCISPMYNPLTRQTLTRFHILISSIMGVLLLLQLSKSFRQRNYKLHKRIGYLLSFCFLLWLMEMGYILFVLGMVPMGTVIWASDVLAWVMVLILWPLGIYAAMQHQLKLHRTCFILLTAGVFMNPVQRLFWSLFSKYDFPYKPSSFQEWLSGPTNWSAYVTFVVNFGLAWYHIMVEGPSNKDLKRMEHHKSE
jgi:hypothetical protein